MGYIGVFPDPRSHPGHQLGFSPCQARSNPNVEFEVVWAYTWFDPAKEAEAATVLIEQGADVILQHTDSTAPQAAAKDAGQCHHLWSGVAIWVSIRPCPRVSSIIDNWDSYYIDRVQAVMDGTWDSQGTWGGMAARRMVGDRRDH
ncbi:MAG: BMP family ABC transporter substrate-binding protein [Cypionkella sp.]|nr:BMP family ABC transporter substrate-binding protein [Cypionkella sp.]